MAQHPDGLPRHGPGRWKYLRWILVVLVLVLAFEYVVLPQLVGTDNVIRSLGRLPPLLLAGALALEVGSWISYSALTRVVLPGRFRPSFFTLFRIDLADTAVNHTVPGGGTTSAAARYKLLTMAGTQPGNALSAATVQFLSANLVLGALFGAGLVAARRDLPASSYYLPAGVVVLVLFVSCCAGVVVLDRRLAGAERFVRRVARVVPFLHPDSAQRFIRTVASETKLFRSEPRRFVAAVLLSALRWTLDAACLWLLLAGFGHVLGFGELFIAYSVARLVALVPLTPGGVGLVEGVLVPALAGLGVPTAIAVQGVLSWRILQFWLPIPVGGLAYLSLRLGVLRHYRVRRGPESRLPFGRRPLGNGPESSRPGS